MSRLIMIVFSVFSLILLPGCWNNFEMTEWGFVQAVAIDSIEEGKIELRTLIYKPGGGGDTMGPSTKGPSHIIIKTKADSVFEAIRDIPLQLGRKAQWSHMRILLFGEQAAKKINVNDLTDFFIRDHEPRETISIMIAQGKASDFLDVKPFIEHTLGQQLRQVEKAAVRFSSKTNEMTLLDLAIQSKSEVGISLVPYARINGGKSKSVAITGVAVLKKGKMVTDYPLEAVKSLLMLVDKYKAGIIEIPCADTGKGSKKLKETLEVGSVKTKIKPVIKGESLNVHVSAKIEGDVGELHCSSIMNTVEEKEFAKKVETTVEDQLRNTIESLQKKKLDTIGIGNKIYGHHPDIWKKWKKNWGERFAESHFDIHVEVTIHNVGTRIGKPPSLK